MQKKKEKKDDKQTAKVTKVHQKQSYCCTVFEFTAFDYFLFESQS
jgi:hypothetical protein